MAVEHLGLNVPDLEAAVAYYDELMPLLGYMRAFPTGYVPRGWDPPIPQIFLYRATADGEHSRLRAGLSHLAFLVPERRHVHKVHDWAVGKGHEILHEPKPFPEYGEDFYATFFLDMHQFHIEAVSFEKPDEKT